MSENPQGSPLLAYQTPETPGLSKARRLAARIAIWIGVLSSLAGTCLGVVFLGVAAALSRSSGGGAGGPSPGSWAVFFGVVGTIAAGFVLALGVTYLVGGILIRRGSRAWVNILFVVAICHEALLGIGLLFGLISLIVNPRSIISFLVQLLYAAAIGQLILNLHRTRQEAM
jgi:hypothetical protein